MHLRIFDVAKDVPIGDISASNPGIIPNGSGQSAVDVDFPESEKMIFDVWLRRLWGDKDEYITEFLERHPTPNGQRAVEIPLELRNKSEIARAFCFFLPAVVTYGCKKVGNLLF
jgi:hypothetical protein